MSVMQRRAVRRTASGMSTDSAATNSQRGMIDRRDSASNFATPHSPNSSAGFHHVNFDQVVKKVPIFANTDEEFRKELVSRLEYESLEGGSWIMREGDTGDEMFIIAKGEVEIIIGPDATVVAKLSAGSFFGEIALIKDSKRNASVRTVDVCEVCCLRKKDFDEVVAKFPGMLDLIQEVAFGRDRAKEVVRKVPIFKDCDDTFVDSLVRRLKPETLNEGDFVIKEGDTGKEMYILYKGEVEVIGGPEQKVLAKLGEGAFFGEIALLKNARRNASIRALTRCETFKLTKNDFDIVLGQYPDYREKILNVANEKQARREESLLPLHLAVRSGQVAEIERVINQGLAKKTKKEQVNLKDEVGWTSLHEAAHGGHANIVTYLIEAGSAIEAQNNEGNTPLHLAAAAGRVESTMALLAAKANLMAMNEDGSTPLHLAARCGEIAVSEAILKEGGSVSVRDVNGNIPLHLAANVGHAECVDFLLKQNSDPNAQNQKGVAPLHDASLSNSGPVVISLINAGAKVDAPDNEIATPLQYAGNNGSANACRELLAKKADPNYRDINGHTPLHHAAFAGVRECVEMMLAHGANIRIRGEDGSAPYHFASMGGYDDIVQLLYYEDLPLVVAVRNSDYDEMIRLIQVEHADVNASHPDDKWTALHEAAARGDTTAIDQLMANGGQLTVLNLENANLLHVAVGSGQIDAVERILAYGGHEILNGQNSVGRTPLHIAAKSGNADMIAFLISQGADTTITDSYGNTAQFYAEKHQLNWSALMENVPKMSIRDACINQDRANLKLALERPDAPELINAYDEDGMAPIHWASHLGFSDGVQMLLNAGAGKDLVYGQGYTPIILATRMGATGAVKALIDGGAEVNTITEDRMSAIVTVPMNTPESDEILNLLLKAGADPNMVEGTNQNTLLHIAAQNADENKLHALLAVGANKRLKNVSGLLPYDLAVDSARPELAPMLADIHSHARENDAGTVKVMLEKGIPADIVEEHKGETPLHSAASQGSVEAARLLLTNLGSDAPRKKKNLDAKTKEGRTPLELACAVPSRKMVDLLLAEGADPNNHGAETSPLAIAASKLDGAPCVSALLAKGANVAATDNDGNTALHKAAEVGAAGCIRSLLEGPEGKKLKTAQNAKGKTPLDIANENGHEEAARVLSSPDGPDVHERLRLAAGAEKPDEVKQLLSEGANIEGVDSDGRSALHYAAAVGSSDCTKVLLDAAEQKQPGLAKTLANAADKDGKTPLMLAAENGDIETMKALIAAGADPNATDASGKTALMYAAMANNAAAVALLIDSGAAIDAVDNDGNTALHHAGIHGSMESAKMLLDKGSKARTMRNNKGQTPLEAGTEAGKTANALEMLGSDQSRLFGALARGDLDQLRHMLETENLDVSALDETDPNGRNALHVAAERGNAEAVRILLAAMQRQGKMDMLDGRDVNEATPLMLAAKNGDIDTVRALLDAGALVNTADAKGMTPLMYATIANHPKVAALLLERGASVDAVDHDGNTALHHAGIHGSAEAAQVLLQHGSKARQMRNKDGKTPRDLAMEADQLRPDNEKNNMAASLSEDQGALQQELHSAIAGKSAEAVADLLARGLDPTAADPTTHRTGLHHAATIGPPASAAIITQLTDAVPPGKRRTAFVNAKDKDGLTALMLAAKAGDTEAMEALIRAGADVNEVDNKGMTALMYAAAANHPAAVAMLIDNGAIVDAVDADGNTALHHAGQHGSAEAAQVLLDKGQSKAKEQKNKAGKTPFDLAKESVGDKDASKLGAFRSDAFQLGEAAKKGDSAAIARLLARLGPNVNVNDPALGDGRTLLGLAAESGSIEAIQELIKAGADVNLADPNTGRTPLHHACDKGHGSAVSHLLNQGADPKLQDLVDGNTPIHLAANCGAASCVRYLVENAESRGPKPAKRMRNHHGKLPRELAVEKNFAEVVDLLTDKDGKEIFLCIANGDEESLKELLKSGADPKVKNSNGETPLHEAAKMNRVAMARILIAHGAPLEATRDSDGATPLLVAAMTASSSQQMGEVLIEKGANVNAADNNGLTALHHAVSEDASEFVRILLVPPTTNANAVTKANKETPAHIAAEKGALKSIQELAKKDFDRTAKDAQGRTPFVVANESGNEACAILLASIDTLCELAYSGNAKRLGFFLDSGCNVHGHCESDGNTLLHATASDPALSALTTTIIGRGVNVNACNFLGETPVFKASSVPSNRKNIESLCTSGADVAMRDKQSRSCLILASGNPGCVDSVKVLLTYGPAGWCQWSDNVGRTALHEAARVGALEIIRLLLHARADKIIKDNNGYMPYDVAVNNNQQEAAELLRIEEKEAISTDIHMAVRAHDMNKITQILDRGDLDVNVRDGNGKTPLHIAIESGIPAAVTLLLSRGADATAVDKWGRTPLHYAALRDEVKIAEQLVSSGADIRAKDNEGITPLHEAAGARSVGVVRLLLSSHTPVLIEALDERGQTPLHYGARGGSQEVVLKLLRAKANPAARDMNSQTPYDIAASLGHIECAVLLADLFQLLHVGSADDLRRSLARGSDPNVIDVSGNSPLHVAAHLNKVDHAKVLLENGALIDRQDRQRNTPLHISCRNGFTDFTLLLLRSGAGITMTERHGCHPIHLACESNDADAVEELILRGADPCSVDLNRSTPLHTCGAYGSSECIKVLREHGAPLFWKRRDGMLPYDLAVKNGHNKAATLLDTRHQVQTLVTPNNGRYPRRNAQTARARELSPAKTQRGVIDVAMFPEIPKTAPAYTARRDRSPNSKQQQQSPRTAYWQNVTVFKSPVPPPITPKSTMSPRHAQVGSSSKASPGGHSGHAHLDSGECVTEHRFLHEYKHTSCIHTDRGLVNRVFVKLPRFNRDDETCDCPICGATDSTLSKSKCKNCGRNMWIAACYSCGFRAEGTPPIMILSNYI